ncbi:MAG: Rieske (2Fe-2S) protein [Bacteroidota bacterium]
MTNIKNELDKGRYINRKTFLRLATFGVAATFVALWSILAGKNKQLSERTSVSRINAAKLGTGIFLFDKYILVKSAASLKVFSNKCTHAGCRINQEIDGQLVCPCHGSRYDSSIGKVLQGPAGLPLSTIPFSTDAKTGEITIKI